MKSSYLFDRGSKTLVLVCASVSFIILLAIAIFTVKEAFPAFHYTDNSIAIIANNSNDTVDGLSKAEVRQIFTGEITNWSEVGGPDQFIEVFSLEDGAGARNELQERIMDDHKSITDDSINSSASLFDSDESLRSAVSTTDWSIGFLYARHLNEDVKALEIDGELPTVVKSIGLFDFIFGTEWRPSDNKYGILAMIIGSIAVTVGAMILAIPLGVACAVLLAEIASNRIRRFLRPAVELLVGIPSVVYGLVGMVLIVPQIRHLGGSGYSILAAAIVLMAMVLPTIISISEDSIRAVPRKYKEAALATGATHWQTIWRVLIPAARSGIIASIILGMGRAIGETMAMMMVIGNAIKIPTSPLDPARTLTGNIAVEINYATGIHQDALFATGVILFLFIMGINSIALLALKKRNV